MYDKTYEMLKRMKEDFIDRNLGEMPLKVFNDENIFQLELRKIFSKKWIFLGFESEIPNIGDYVVRHIGPDQFIVIRGSDGKIRGLFNSCRHRGTPLCLTERGNAREFMCPYHGWAYNNKGELIGIPYKEKHLEKLNLSEWGLAQIRVETYDGLIFGCMEDNGMSLSEYLGDFKWYLDIIFKATGGMETIEPPQRLVADFDWKLGAEQLTSDRIHTIVLHKTLVIYNFIGKSRFGTAIEAPDDVTITEIKGGDGLPVGSIGIRRTERKEDSAFLGYPKEEWNALAKDSVSAEQWDILRRAVSVVFTLFPNFSGFILADATDSPLENKPRVPIHSFRVWNPLGPGLTETWVWTIAPKGMSSEFKKRVSEVTRGTFGIAGNAEMDDFAHWRILVVLLKEFLPRR